VAQEAENGKSDPEPTDHLLHNVIEIEVGLRIPHDVMKVEKS